MSANAPTPTGETKDDVVLDDVPASKPDPKLIAVMSARGGCGGTVVATHLALALAGSRPTCLLDLDTSKGDVAGYLDLPSARSVNVVLDRLDDLDDNLLRGCVEVHESGLHVLVQPYDLMQLREVSAEETARLLAYLGLHYASVVVDLGAQVDAPALTAALRADEIVLVATPDVPGIRSAQRVLALLRRLAVPEAKVRLVLNKVQGNAGLPRDEIAAQLGVEVAAELPRADAAASRIDATGRPLSEEAPSSPLTAAITDLWPTLRGQPHVHTGRIRWPWSR